MRQPGAPNDMTIALNVMMDKMIKFGEKIEQLEARIEGRPAPHIPQNLYPRLPEEDLTETASIDRIEKYEKCIPMIPEFDGQNAEQFINMIMRVRTILVEHQHQYLLLAILSQKLKGKAATSIRADTIPSLDKLIEKVRFLYGKTVDVSALATKRNLCKQKPNESVDEFIERFSKIHDEVITAINTNNDPTMIETREILATEESVRAFKRNARRDISVFLLGQRTNDLQSTFEAARMFDLETRYSRMFDRNDSRDLKRDKRDIRSKPKFCNYCKRNGHVEEECRTKKYHQEHKDQKKDFHRDHKTTNPPGSTTMAQEKEEESTTSPKPLSKTEWSERDLSYD